MLSVVDSISAILFLRHFRATNLGKMLSSILACLQVFVYWAIVAVFVWIPYAFLQHNLRYPNRIVRSYDQTFEYKNGNWTKDKTSYSFKALTIVELLNNAFFNMFGELFYETLDPESHRLVFIFFFKSFIFCLVCQLSAVKKMLKTKISPKDCSDALSSDYETGNPCSDYVSTVFTIDQLNYFIRVWYPLLPLELT